VLKVLRARGDAGRSAVDDPGCVKTLTLFWKVEVASQFRATEPSSAPNICREAAAEKTILNEVRPGTFSHSLDPKPTFAPLKDYVSKR
jgi:hypothetical protein